MRCAVVIERYLSRAACNRARAAHHRQPSAICSFTCFAGKSRTAVSSSSASQEPVGLLRRLGRSMQNQTFSARFGIAVGSSGARQPYGTRLFRPGSPRQSASSSKGHRAPRSK